MAEQYPRLVNKQFNSPINLYSDKNVREILERETQILKNGAMGIDFNNPMVGKPTNLQNSAVLRMLEEEENRKRDGQPGSLKRVAWPPPREGEDEDFVEQEPIEVQGGPLFSSKSAPSLQQNQVPIQQPQSPNYQQAPQSNTFQPGFAVSHPPEQQHTPYQSAPISPGINISPVNFTPSTTPLSPSLNKSPISLNLAKPWAPVSSPVSSQFKSVQPPSPISQPSKVFQIPVQLDYQSAPQQAPSLQQNLYQPTYEPTGKVYEIPVQLNYQQTPPPQPTLYQPPYEQFQEAAPQSPVIVASIIEQYSPQITGVPPQFTPSQSITPARPKPQITIPTQQVPSPKIQSAPPQQYNITAQPRQSQPTSTPAQAQNQAPQPKLQKAPAVKPVVPPPSTITLRPNAPVSQAPPPLITSQPATATLRGGKKLRGDLKWPPEEVKEKMEAEKQHLVDLEKGPAVRPRKNCKDYSGFFAKHALNSTYPGYKIPPGTQFYDHNPVM